jgi:hypothetical protein
VRRAAGDLRRVDRGTVENVVATIPSEWDVAAAGRRALVDFIVGRAVFLSEDVPCSGHTRPRILTMLWPQGDLFPPGKPEARQ